MVSIFLIISSIPVSKRFNTEIAKMHCLSIYLDTAHHDFFQGAGNGAKGAIPAQNRIFDLLLPFFNFFFGHCIFFFIGQGLIVLGRICIIELIHFIDQSAVLLDEVLDHVVDAVCIFRCCDGYSFIGFLQSGNRQTVDLEYIVAGCKFGAVQFDNRILAFGHVAQISCFSSR